MNTQHIHTCKRCGIRYDWRKSPSSSLKMTYCGSLCEHADLGFTIEAMLERRMRQTTVRVTSDERRHAEPVPVLAA